MAKQTFLDKLAELRVMHCEQMPTPEMAVLTRATARLRRSGILQSCLQRGETAPNFTFIDANNDYQSLFGLLKTGPVVLNFFRGYWCMYCKTELAAYVSIRDEMEASGFHYLAICPQKTDDDGEQGDEHYHVLFDRNNGIASQFGIVYSLGEDERKLFRSWNLRLDEVNQTADWSLPIPATYVVAQDKTVAFQFVDADIRSRCCPDELIKELQHLARDE
jgi:peroxiredoxin